MQHCNVRDCDCRDYEVSGSAVTVADPFLTCLAVARFAGYSSNAEFMIVNTLLTGPLAVLAFDLIN